MDILFSVIGRPRPFDNNNGNDARTFAQLRLRNVSQEHMQAAFDRCSGHPVRVTRNNSGSLRGFVVNLTTTAEKITGQEIEDLLDEVRLHVKEIVTAARQAAAANIERQRRESSECGEPRSTKSKKPSSYRRVAVQQRTG